MTRYLRDLIDRIFAVLPLYEEFGAGADEWQKYVDSLWVEMSGACRTFPVLWETVDYISALNILAFLNMHAVTHAQCKRETFKAIDLIKKVLAENGGANE